MAAVASGLTACAITPEQFYANRTSYTDEQVCSMWRHYDGPVEQGAIAEAARRGISVDRCTAILAAAEQRNANVAAGLMLILALGAASQGAATAPMPMMPVASDTEWAWDQYRNDAGNLVWACRGVQTGQFWPEVRCQFLPKLDIRWPGPLLR
jgi:hypothetical protein